MSFAIGAQVPLPYTVRDGTGALVDATTVSITITAPDGSTSTITLAGGGIVRQSLGTYLGIFIPTLAGRHTWSGSTTGPVTALEPDAFNITAAADAPITSLADARSWLNIDRPDYDNLIRRALARATEVAEDWTGELYRRTSVTEVHDGGKRALQLRARPVISITSVTQQGTVLSATPGVDWTLDSTAALLYRGSSVTSWDWTWGVNAVQVVLLAGYTVVPDRYLGAVEELTRHFFAALQDGAGQPAGDDEYAATVPEVRKLCALLLGPRISSI